MGSMWDRLKPALLMIGVQIVFSACNILYKFAIFDGMSTIVIAAYRLAFATVTTIPLALIFERYLGWDVRLFTVAFSGIMASGVMVLVLAWVVQTKGPLYASTFNPLMLLFVAFVASMLLDEKLNLGSILGGALIVCGLYTVLWGKSREIQKKIELEPTEIIGDSEATRPLLSP
ncbi:hypothetical protein P8452_33434 [Trifolium repens]|nr:hypothetical protein P8452_33434 [Trifolium repens]